VRRPARIVKVIEEDALLGNEELCPLFSRLELSGCINQALTYTEAVSGKARQRLESLKG